MTILTQFYKVETPKSSIASVLQHILALHMIQTCFSLVEDPRFLPWKWLPIHAFLKDIDFQNVEHSKQPSCMAPSVLL